MEEQQLHRVQLHHAKAEGPLPSIVDTIRSIRESVLNKTTLEDVLKPAIRSVAFIFDDTRVADALAFLQDQKILSAPVVSRRDYLIWRHGGELDREDHELRAEGRRAGHEKEGTGSAAAAEEGGGTTGGGAGGLDPNSVEALLRALEEQRRAGGPLAGSAAAVHGGRQMHAADNPPMRVVLGFLSLSDILAALSAELEGIPVSSAGEVREVIEAATELFRTPIREAFDTGTLSTDWESVGSGEGADWSAFWAVRGLGSTKQSLLDIIRDGFLSGARLLRRRK